MVRSCGADVSVVASWMGWIRTLASVLVVSLDGIVSSTGALSWSYWIWWFKEVSNGVRGLVCVIPGCAGLSSSYAWLQGSIGILATSFGFAKCFCKPSSISQVNFCNLKVIPKLGGDFAAISKFGDHFAEKWHVHRLFLKLGAFSQRRGILAAHFAA